MCGCSSRSVLRAGQRKGGIPETALASSAASRRRLLDAKASEPDGRTRPRHQVQALLESILRPFRPERESGRSAVDK
jgi:hypothetical protein